jgi:hypothetical protein
MMRNVRTMSRIALIGLFDSLVLEHHGSERSNDEC